MPWLKPAVGVVAGGAGGSAEGEKEYKGMFNLFGAEVWLYIGGLLGFGETIGPYGTAGLMLGADPDVGVGAGIHFGKKLGLGLIVPIRRAYEMMNAVDPKALEQTKEYAEKTVENIQQMGFGGLEAIAQNPLLAVPIVATVGILAYMNRNQIGEFVRGTGEYIVNLKDDITQKLYDLS